jgi:hypothetical protein
MGGYAWLDISVPKKKWLTKFTVKYGVRASVPQMVLAQWELAIDF